MSSDDYRTYGSTDTTANVAVFDFYLTAAQFKKTINFLKSREDDIASDFEDLGELKDLFRSLIHREPEKSNP